MNDIDRDESNLKNINYVLCICFVFFNVGVGSIIRVEAGLSIGITYNF